MQEFLLIVILTSMSGGTMHRHLIPIRLLFAVTVMTAAMGNVFGQEEKVDYNASLIEALEGYQKLVSAGLESGEEDNTALAWLMVSRAIQEGFLRFTVNPSSKGFLVGTRFKALPGENVAHIIVAQDLLKFWPDRPSIVYSIMAGAFREAATFFQDPPAWGAAQRDLMEKLLIKVDNYIAQAELIQERLLPGGYFLSAYDTYILDSYEQDGLASVVLFLDRFSLPVVQGLYQFRLAYEKNRNGEALRTAILELGETLLASRNQVPADGDDQEKYPFAIAIHSWLEFTPDIIARIHNRDKTKKPLTFDQILAREKEYKELRHELETSRTRDLLLIERIVKDVGEKFGVPQK